jgi:hypothetical protein
MGYGKCDCVMAKCKKIKNMRKRASRFAELSGQMSLRAIVRKTSRPCPDWTEFMDDLKLGQLSERTIAHTNLYM